MKSKIAVVVIILVAALAAPYFIKGPDGKPLLSLHNETDAQQSTEQTRQTFYKWQDDQGQWHFADEVPAGVNAVAVEVDTAANVLQSVTLPAEVAAEKPQPEAPAEVSAPSVLPMTVDPAAIPKLIDDAKNIQTLLDERSRKQQ